MGNPPLQLSTQIEAFLYLKGQPVTLIEISHALDCDMAQTQQSLLALMTEYAHRDSALEIVETNAGYSLQLRSCFQGLITDLVPAELGLGCLRTLAAIALKNPMVQTELIQLRGSSAYQQVQELVDLGLIRKHRLAKGRTYSLELTDKFYQYFEIEQISQILESTSISLIT